MAIRKKNFYDWVATEQPLWARDALRRLALDEPYEKIKKEVLINLKKEKGISIPDKTDLIDFTADHFKAELPSDNPKTLLCSIGPSKHVNRLADDQVMKFALDGVTLIYGDNGSGKSGYCRISKQLCRARVPEDILDNAYKDGKPEKAEVIVKYQCGDDAPIETKWIKETDPPEPLRRLTVFDAACARFYVDKDNKIEYLPAEIELLNRHTNLLKYLQEQLKSEITALENQIPRASPFDFFEGTSASKLSGRLNQRTPLNELPAEHELENFAVWNEEGDKQIAALKKRIAEDPAARLSKLGDLKDTMVNLLGQIGVIETALCDAKIDGLEQAFNLVETTAQIVKTNATGYFKDDLPGTGTNPWKKMYEYATEYAKTIEGTNNKIPSDIDELCLLCQQTLDVEASKRLKKFEEFVSNQASKDAKRARDDLKEKTIAIGKIIIMKEVEAELLLKPYMQLDERTRTIATSIKIFFTEASQLLSLLKDCIENNKFTRPAIRITAINPQLNEYMIALEAVIKKLEDERANSRHDDNLQGQWNELDDKRKFSKSIKFFIQRLKYLQLLKRLEECRGELSLGKVSSKIKSLGNDILAGELKENIGEEIEALDLAHIPFKIKNKTDRGDTLVGMDLETLTPISKHKILSEGEQRALALACFLAEVKRDPIKHGIIIDDPVSSLDHIRITRVAERLVVEAKDKQVIIFTHNILFYNEVRNFAIERQIACHEHYMYKVNNEKFGMIDSADKNWQAMPVEDRINALDDLANTIAKNNYTDAEEYRSAVKNFYTNLRETWERLVEQVLLNKVVTRYDPAVQTLRLAGVIVEKPDYETIYWAMTEASKYSGHDKAIGNTHPLPNLDDIKKDIKIIRDFKKKIKDRSKLCAESRKDAVLNPLKANTV